MDFIVALVDETPSWFMGALIASLSVLIGLAVAIITPILKLNKNITKLNDSVDTLNTALDDTKKALADEQAKRELLEQKITQHGEWLAVDKVRLDNHEIRIGKVESKEKEQPK